MPRHTPWLLVATLWMATPVGAAAPKGVLPFPAVDQSGDDPSFLAFRRGLLAAIKRNDLHFLRAAAYDEAGVADALANPKTQQAWMGGLQTALSRGCAAMEPQEDSKGMEYICPYVSAHWPAKVDPTTHVAVTRNRVNLRQAPSKDAVKLGTVGEGIYPLCSVKKAGKDAHVYKGYVCLKTPLAEQGFVHHRYVASPRDFTVTFRWDGESWGIATAPP